MSVHSILVDKIDNNKDGYVSEEELKVWIHNAQQKYIFDNVQNQWNDFDVNNDGHISWDEYKNVTYGSYLGNNQLSNLIIARTELHVQIRETLLRYRVTFQ